MSDLLHELIRHQAAARPASGALTFQGRTLSYEELCGRMDTFAQALIGLGLERGERVGIYLDKQFETIEAIFGTAAAGGVFVPINPLLKARQVGYILRDCNIRILVTARARFEILGDEIARCPDLGTVILVDGASNSSVHSKRQPKLVSWGEIRAAADPARAPHRVIDADMAAILYTSGSTGRPKGVVLSHRNMVAGAKSVSQYLENNPDDVILAVLPLSFDAGFSQLTTAFTVGARAVLMNYLLPRDVVRMCAAEGVTGLTGVPPLWIQLAMLDWPEEASATMRYFANTGGRMPRATLDLLRKRLPAARPYLMYGLTEAFRSTYLPPEEVDRRPDSIGKAIPNVEVMVVRSDGALCAPGEEGELVHRGALVAMGYWNDPERTAQRFRPAPGQSSALCAPEIAVWSGDIVRMDEDGFLYFVGRNDEMIKTSGYRVSPTEIEEVLYESGLVGEAVALGLPHPTLGQEIVVGVTARGTAKLDTERLIEICRAELPLYMVPARVVEVDAIPRSPNGKMDRRALAALLAGKDEEGDG